MRGFTQGDPIVFTNYTKTLRWSTLTSFLVFTSCLKGTDTASDVSHFGQGGQVLSKDAKMP